MLTKLGVALAVSFVSAGFSVAAFAQPAYRVLTVDAINVTDTGMWITAGQTVTGKAAGYVSWGNGSGGYGPTATPTGNPLNSVAPAGSSYTAPRCRSYTLIGRVGNGPWFCLGLNINFVAKTTGELYLWFNDNNYGDNHGAYSVELALPY